MPLPNNTGTWLMQSSSTRPRFSACWMMSALAMVTNLSPAMSFAVEMPSSTLPVKVVRGNRSAASSGGGRWVTTTTGAPAGWLSPQPSVWSNSRRPAMMAPQPEVSSCSIGALAASTEKLMLSCALGTTTSPFQYQSNNSAGLSSGWATKPSSDMHMWVSTLAMLYTTPPAPPTHRQAPDICHALGHHRHRNFRPLLLGNRTSMNDAALPRLPKQLVELLVAL